MGTVTESYVRVEQACDNCQRTCESCVYGCCAESGQSDHGQMCLTCTPICSACAKLASANPDWAPQLCQLCTQLIKMCTAGVDESGENGPECVTAWQACAAECQTAVA